MSKSRNITLTGDKVADFKAFATARTERVLTALRVLGNCGNRGNYAPDDASIARIETALLAAVEKALDELRNGRTASDAGFKL